MAEDLRLSTIYPNGANVYANDVLVVRSDIGTSSTVVPDPIIGWYWGSTVYRLDYPGYQFVEWNKASDGSGATVPIGDDTGKPAELYAIWEPDSGEGGWRREL